MRKILLPAVTATSVMTLFSYLIAEEEKKNFSESKLLAKIEKKQLHIPKQFALAAGWTTHYSIGVLMALLFELYKKDVSRKNALYHTMTFGILGGALSLAAWKQLFKMLPRRQRNFYKKFYTQLFIAHLIFAAVLTATQKAMKSY